MSMTVEAVYENGVLKPLQPPALKDQELVEITITTKRDWVRETAGIIGWKGNHESLQRILDEMDEDENELP